MFIPSTFKRPVSSWKALNLRKTLLMASSVRLKPLNCSRLPCVYAQGNTDVLTDAEENVRQKLRAEGVMYCLKVKNVLALALVVRSRCEVLKASVKALVFGM